MAVVFFSYSHRDEDLRNELETHLSPLKRQGIIESWHDRRIGAGKEFDHEISEHLEEADIILLLVSPYFIASDYCYDVELQRAMERHEAGEARVVPVILHPCDWQSLLFGKLNATPKDGKPLSKFPNVHEGFLDVAQAIRKAAEEINARRAKSGAVPSSVQSKESIKSSQPAKVVPEVRSSNLRIKQTFTDREKDKFQNEAFEYIANYFEGSLVELQKRNPEIETEFRRIDANHFTATVYVNGSEASRCKIWLGGRRGLPGGIAYKEGHSFVDNDSGFNESLSVNDDGYNLFLQPIGFMTYGREKKMTFEGAAEFYWESFIRPLQR
jgi:hypothetical protein